MEKDNEIELKMDYAAQLIKSKMTYRDIQEALKTKFGSALSNTTLKKLKRKMEVDYSKDREIARLKKELEIFKNLYFELLEKVNKEFIDVEKEDNDSAKKD